MRFNVLAVVVKLPTYRPVPDCEFPEKAIALALPPKVKLTLAPELAVVLVMVVIVEVAFTSVVLVLAV